MGTLQERSSSESGYCICAVGFWINFEPEPSLITSAGVSGDLSGCGTGCEAVIVFIKLIFRVDLSRQMSQRLEVGFSITTSASLVLRLTSCISFGRKRYWKVLRSVDVSNAKSRRLSGHNAICLTHNRVQPARRVRVGHRINALNFFLRDRIQITQL